MLKPLELVSLIDPTNRPSFRSLTPKFQWDAGDFAERKVYLLDAEMERLDEEVFGPVLRSMEDAKSGALFLDSKTYLKRAGGFIDSSTFYATPQTEKRVD